MTRADLLVRLAEVASRGDGEGVRQTVHALAAEERRKHHHILAERLLNATQSNGRLRPRPGREDAPLLVERVPERSVADLYLPAAVRLAVDQLVEEQHRAELLRSHGLEPRNRVLLVGPPGNGKTTLAGAIAGELGRPLLVPAYDQVIRSLLGETAGQLAKVFDTVASRYCVLFLDELDILAKERADEHETGEMKRVVSSLLLHVDSLPSHVVVIGATNHPGLLDRATWRRFELRLSLPAPGETERRAYLAAAAQAGRIRWGWSPKRLAEALGPLSYGELEQFVGDVRRRIVLEEPARDAHRVVDRCVRQWQARVSADAPGVL